MKSRCENKHAGRHMKLAESPDVTFCFIPGTTKSCLPDVNTSPAGVLPLQAALAVQLGQSETAAFLLIDLRTPN
ncbi:unnamed protein product [Allacma fusca]|uniref:Uncharacterized protein n=1 Tax=Allacma fusca TaxID=39272 RepID=A0A8J2Q6P7_9HEXA|nr:unnamed protein product [Allacma fusca]